MRGAAEFTVFAAVAAAVHVALFAAAPQTGAQSSGAGGEEMISVQAASATVAEMVAAWEQPPEMREPPRTALPHPQAAPQAPELPQFDVAQAPKAAVQIALQEPEAAETIVADTAPPPPPEPKPEAKVKPKARPNRPPDPQPQQAREADVTSAGRAEQRAAGAGGSASAGSAGGSEAKTAKTGQTARLQSVWGAKIGARIAGNQRYPLAGRGNAKVFVELTVARDGRLLSHRIARSSGNSLFDQAALQAIALSTPLPAAPKKLRLNEITFTLPMSFTHPG